MSGRNALAKLSSLRLAEIVKCVSLAVWLSAMPVDEKEKLRKKCSVTIKNMIYGLKIEPIQLWICSIKLLWITVLVQMV